MPTGIYKHKPHTEKTKNKIGNGNRGKIRSQKTKDKISKSVSIVRTGTHHSQETKDKIGNGNRGKIHNWKQNNEHSRCMIGRKHTKETIIKMKNSLSKHHIWYEDNEGNPTDKGTMMVTSAHHSEIHAVLRHNHWTDNRRYLAG